MYAADHAGDVASLTHQALDRILGYVVSSPEAIRRAAALFNRYPDRFLFGTDTVAPKNSNACFAVFGMWKPSSTWSNRSPGTRY